MTTITKIPPKFEKGKIYKIRHSRKGVFTIEVEAVDDEWVQGWIVSGTAHAIMDYNVKEQGENITLRISFCTILENLSAAAVKL